MRQKLEIVYNPDVVVDFYGLCQVLCARFGIVIKCTTGINKVFTDFEPKEKIEQVLTFMRRFKDFESTATVKVIDEI